MEICIFPNNISFKKFLVFVSIGVLVSLIFGFSEFVLKNTLNFSFDELIPRPIVEDYSPFFLGKFIRVRSFVEESGHYAFYLELLFPITFYYLFYSDFSKIPQTLKNLYVLLFIVCFILTFSSAGIVIFGTFCLMFFIIYSIKKIRAINFKFGITIIFGLFFLFLSYIFFNKYLILELDFSLIEIFQTLTVDKVNSTTSGYDRSYRIENALEIIKDANLINIFFGFGPAAYDTNLIDPVIGLYFVLLFETGVFGLFFFIMFFVLTVINNFRIKNLALRNSLLISLLSGIVHYLFIGNYYYPWIWIVAALINLIARWDQRKLYI
ncbi:hypothetical protein [Lacihabitans lacunae]|uniref:O-antigen ligase domain-containing protein n=1 Tax=Lacihabitans lacunae TaxID=1028214 RepID=A0ABV7YYF7_9BACT